MEPITLYYLIDIFLAIGQYKVLENLVKRNKFNSPTIPLLLVRNNHHKYSVLAPELLNLKICLSFPFH